MMKVKFTNYGAAIFLENNSIKFEQTVVKVAGATVFKCKSTDIMTTLKQEEDKIKKIIEMYPVDYIFVCDIKTFSDMLKYTEPQELNVEMFLNKKREMMPYATFGISPAAVLIISCVG